MIKYELKQRVDGNWYTYGNYSPDEPALMYAIKELSQRLNPDDIKLETSFFTDKAMLQRKVDGTWWHYGTYGLSEENLVPAIVDFINAIGPENVRLVEALD